MVRNTALVVGYGSIGQRHTRLLMDLGYKTIVVSKRKLDVPFLYHDLEEAIKKEEPKYIIVANDTFEHENTLLHLEQIKYTSKVLVEKPLFPGSHVKSSAMENVLVGYNLRFHPLIQTLKAQLINEKILSVQAYVGQYLPYWRPDTDYTKSYSAMKSKGGGVIRDLSHELDYLQFLFGDWKELVAWGGKISDLSITTDDSFSLIYQTEKVKTISLQMNYLDFNNERFVIINTPTKTYKANFIKNTLKINNKTTQFSLKRDDTYIKQHLAIIKENYDDVCSYKQAFNIVKMIEMAEYSSKEKVWVYNE